VSQFRKRPVVIEAVQFDGALPVVEAPQWLFDAVAARKVWRAGNVLHIVTLEGTMTASQGDWIIRGVKGELYPCKPDIFEATYEPASSRPASVSPQPEGQKSLIADADRWLAASRRSTHSWDNQPAIPIALVTQLRNALASQPEEQKKVKQIVDGYDAEFWRDSYRLLSDAVLKHLDRFVQDDDVAEEAIFVKAIEDAGERALGGALQK